MAEKLTLTTIIGLTAMLFFFFYAIVNKRKIWPIIVIQAFVIFSGIVNGAGELWYVRGAAFSHLFEGSRLIRVLGTGILVIITLTHIRKNPFKLDITFMALVLVPILMFFNYIGTGKLGYSHSLLGLSVKIGDVIAFFLITRTLCREEHVAAKYSYGLCIIGIIYIFVCTLAILFDPEGSFRAGFRFRGISLSVNWTGTYLAQFLLPIFAQHTVETRKNIIFQISIFMGISYLLMTGSRSAISCFVISAIILSFFIVTNNRNTTRRLKKILSILILVGSVFFIVNYWQHDAFILTKERFILTIDGQLDTRQLTWSEAIQKWQKGDIFLGSSNVEDGVESLYVTMLSVYGILGLSVLLFSFLMILKSFFNIQKSFRNLYWAVAFASFIGFCLNCIFEALYLGTMSAFNPILYLIIGIGLTSGDSIKRNKRDSDV